MPLIIIIKLYYTTWGIKKTKIKKKIIIIVPTPLHIHSIEYLLNNM